MIERGKFPSLFLELGKEGGCAGECNSVVMLSSLFVVNHGKNCGVLSGSWFLVVWLLVARENSVEALFQRLFLESSANN